MEEVKARYEIWLGDHYSHFDRGIAYLEDGRTIALKSWVHVASYGSDSVLIDDEEHYTYGRFPVRWFMRPGAMEFYSWDETVPSLLIHNSSSEEIRVDRYCVLKPGESKELMRNEHF